MHLGECTEEKEHLIERTPECKSTKEFRRKPRRELTKEFRQELRRELKVRK